MIKLDELKGDLYRYQDIMSEVVELRIQFILINKWKSLIKDKKELEVYIQIMNCYIDSVMEGFTHRLVETEILFDMGIGYPYVSEKSIDRGYKYYIKQIKKLKKEIERLENKKVVRQK